MSMTDMALLERWVTYSDAEAFAELVTRHQSMVYATCRRILGHSGDVEDVAQECFIEVVRLAASKRVVKTSVPAWLHSVATHRSLDRIRAEGRRRRRERHYATESAVSVSVMSDEVGQFVDEAITALPEKLRVPLVDHFLAGKSHRVVAEALGIPRTTATSRISKGVEEVRKQLKRRGVSIGASALTTLLVAEAALAAPATLTAALGKLALTGGTTELATPATLTSAATLDLFALGGILMTKKVAVLIAVLAMVCGGYVFLRGLDEPISLTSEGAAIGAALKEDATQPPVDNRALRSAATLEGGVLAVNSSNSIAPNEEQDASLAALAGVGMIRGKVCDSNGEAVADASVVGYSGVAKFGEDARSTTDARGAFSLSVSGRGTYALGASKSGRGFGAVTGIKAGSEGVLISLEATGTISGRLYDFETDEGIQDIYLSARPVKRQVSRETSVLRARLLSRRSGADGTYRIELPAPASYSLVVMDTGAYTEPDWRSIPVLELTADEDIENVNIGLARGGTISGFILDEHNKGIAGAHVDFVDKNSGSNTPRGKMVSGEDGAYAFRGLKRGATYGVRASLEGFASTASDAIMLQGPENITDVNLYLGQGRAVSGQVVTSAGEGAPGLTLVFLSGDKEDNAPIPFLKTVSDGRGFFSMANVAPGTYRSSVTTSINLGGMATKIGGVVFSVPADSDVEGLLIDIGPGVEGFIRGRVTDTGGNPLADTGVGAHSLYGHAWSRTDKDGFYQIEGLGSAETWDMELFGGKGFGYENRRDVPVNSEGVDFVRATGGVIRGVAIDGESGQPISRFEVRSKGAWTEFTSSTGEFTLSGINSPTVVLAGRAAGYVLGKTESIAVAPGETVDGVVIKLFPGETVSGVVLDGVTGQPIQGARVRTFERRLNASEFTERRLRWAAGDPITDREGRFQLIGIEPGIPVDLVAWAAGYAPSMLMKSVEAEETLLLWRGGSLAGVVLDGDEVASGADLCVFRHAEHDPLHGANYRACVVADGAGEFALEALPPGNYTVMSSKGGPRSQVVIVDGETTVLDVQRRTEVVVQE